LVSLDRLQQLEACEAQAALQAQHIELLQKQIADADAALKLELARGAQHAEALMHIARTCDERTSEMKEQHAAVVRVKATVEDENAALKLKLAELAASHATVKEANAALKTENAALKAQAASTLTEILAAVTAITTGAMEILPVRSDSRQFVEWRVGGIPSPLPPLRAVELPPAVEPPVGSQFDRAWCAAVCANGWKVDIDAAVGDVPKSRGTFQDPASSAAPPRCHPPALRCVSAPVGNSSSCQRTASSSRRTVGASGAASDSCRATTFTAAVQPLQSRPPQSMASSTTAGGAFWSGHRAPEPST
jgi:hypothetical protein